MPVRGQRPFLPKRGEAPSGIFSTRGSQKKDPVTSTNTGIMNYSLSQTGSKPKGSGGQSLRHQKPKRIW